LSPRETEVGHGVMSVYGSSVWRAALLVAYGAVHCSCEGEQVKVVEWSVLSTGHPFQCKNATEEDLGRDCSYVDDETPPEWACLAEGDQSFAPLTCDGDHICLKVTVQGGGCDATTNTTCGQVCNGAGCTGYTRSVMVRVVGIAQANLRLGQGPLAALCPHRCEFGSGYSGMDVCVADPAECKKVVDAEPHGCWPTAPDRCAPSAMNSLQTAAFIATVTRVPCPEGREYGVGWLVCLTVVSSVFVIASLFLWRKGRQKQGAMFEELMKGQQQKTIEELTTVGGPASGSATNALSVPAPAKSPGGDTLPEPPDSPFELEKGALVGGEKGGALVSV